MDNHIIVETLTLLIIIGISGGFGGVVSALLITHASPTNNMYERKYILPCPLNPSRPKKLGFFGDMIVGSAAGISVFVGLEGLLGVNITIPLAQSKDIVRLIALGVISGYMGASILDTIALQISTRLIEKRLKYGKELNKLHEIEKQFESYQQVMRLLWVGDAFLRWKEYQTALEKYNLALTIEPKNVHILIHKSFVLAAMAENPTNTAEEKAMLYARAIEDMDTVINIIPENIENNLDRYNKGRGYYNRACYIALNCTLKTKDFQDQQIKDEILNDLQNAIKCDAIFASMAVVDPDLKCLREHAKYELILGQI